jgi:hypothetical protein
VVALVEPACPKHARSCAAAAQQKISENLTIDSVPGRQGAEVKCGIDRRWGRFRHRAKFRYCIFPMDDI